MGELVFRGEVGLLGLFSIAGELGTAAAALIRC